MREKGQIFLTLARQIPSAVRGAYNFKMNCNSNNSERERGKSEILQIYSIEKG